MADRAEVETRPDASELGALFVAVTGEEAITEGQEAGGTREPLVDDTGVAEAVADGLEDAIDGTEADGGDPAG